MANQSALDFFVGTVVKACSRRSGTEEAELDMKALSDNSDGPDGFAFAWLRYSSSEEVGWQKMATFAPDG